MIINREEFNLFKKIFVYMKPYKFKLFISFILMIVGSGIGLVTPFLLGGILQSLSDKSSGTFIYKYILLFVIIGLIQMTVTSLNQIINIKMNSNIVLDLKVHMYEKLLCLSMRCFDETSVGEFISRIEGDANELINIITNNLLNLAINIIKTVVIGVLVFKINKILGFIVLISFPFTYYIFEKFGRKIKKESEKLKIMNDKYYGFLNQSLTGIKYIKINKIAEENLQFYKKISEELKNKRIHISFLNVISNILAYIVNEIDTILVLVLGVFYVINGQLSIQLFVAFISYSSEFSNCLQSLTNMNIIIQQSVVSLERVFGIIDNLTFEKEVLGSMSVQLQSEDIQFKNIKFSYDKKKDVFKNLNFTIKHKGLTVIMGKSGIGKSTILSLLSGIYKVDDGNIKISNVNINDLNKEFFKRNISFVPQEPFLFNLSIMDNFKLIVKDATEEDIIKVCKKTYIYDYILSLDNKFNTLIEDNSSNLSYGQKQRISLAICLLKDTPIILLDEVTSGLDKESKEYVMKTIVEVSNNKHIVMVSHDTNINKYANRVLNLKGGQIIDEDKKIIII